ncbi:MAG: class I SAM-dependent methyltransferase [Oscillospiraceae bacterium]|jgi:tRNA (adenine22-N1)-methyltransferase|nr:class I SAM-dependent methyltransferase [Oscillospiraceae bacterium]
MIKLDERLAACAALVRRGSSVADIGTDHALLPVFLWQSGWTDIIATDIKPGPLESARKNIEKYSADIKLVLSDGFENLPPRDDIIIAGMGGETIAEILAGCRHKDENTRFILQPMTKQDRLRRSLDELGFNIVHEHNTYERTKVYTIIYARYMGEKF